MQTHVGNSKLGTMHINEKDPTQSVDVKLKSCGKKGAYWEIFYGIYDFSI